MHRKHQQAAALAAVLCFLRRMRAFAWTCSRLKRGLKSLGTGFAYSHRQIEAFEPDALKVALRTRRYPPTASFQLVHRKTRSEGTAFGIE